MSEEKILFTAKLEISKDKRGFYFEDVRTRSGDVVAKYLIPKLQLNDKDSLMNLEQGCFLVFLANVDFKDIEILWN